MKTKQTKITNRNKPKPFQLDQELYTSLKEYGVVKSSDQLSKLLGKNESYFRSMKCRQYALNLSSLLRLQIALDKTASEEDNVNRAILLRYAESVVKGVVYKRCGVVPSQVEAILKANPIP